MAFMKTHNWMKNVNIENLEMLQRIKIDIYYHQMFKLG